MARYYDDLIVRWTVGDVSVAGFEALRLSTHGARRIFGPAAHYVVCVNTVPLDRARALTGPVPPEIEWLDATDALSPLIAEHSDASRAGGVLEIRARSAGPRPPGAAPGQRLRPLVAAARIGRVAVGRRRSLSAGRGCGHDAGTVSGTAAGAADRIRGLPPGFDLEAAFADILRQTGITLRSELDEQGLVTLACSRPATPHVVGEGEVAICGPSPRTGRHSAGAGRISSA